MANLGRWQPYTWTTPRLTIKKGERAWEEKQVVS